MTAKVFALEPRTAYARPEEMLATLRFRICSAEPDAALLLHEGKLALEFGVSRTPIRQVLHRLAFERLVETRSGIGTVASVLDLADQAKHAAMLAGMLRLGKLCAPESFDAGARFMLAANAESAANRAESSPETFFNLQARLVEAVGQILSDPVAIEAHAAMHWRMIRWNMRAMRTDAAAAFANLDKLLSRLKSAASPAEFLDMLADAQDAG